MGIAKPTNEHEIPEQHREKLHEIVKGARDVLLLTHGDGDSIDGRPMHLVRTDDDTTVYLVTSIDTKKVDELKRNPRATVAVKERSGTVMLDGEVRVSQDRSLIDELWEDSWKVWFSDGKDDPTIAILVVSPIQGTYWEQGIGQGLSYLYRMVKARVTGQDMEIKPGDTGTVDMRRS